MQTNTLKYYDNERRLNVSINGYTKDDNGAEIVQVCIGSCGGAFSHTLFFSPDEARRIAAALAAAATAAELPE